MYLSKPSSVTHILFDLDGLLVDSEVYYEKAYFEVCGKYGEVFDWNLKVKITGRPEKEGAEILCRQLSLPINADQFVSETRMLFETHLKETQLMPGVKKLLDHLHKNEIPMAIASSSDIKEFPLKTSKIHEVFPGSYFHHKVFSPQEPLVKQPKPFPDIFLVARDKFSYHSASKGQTLPPPSSFLVFEDSVSGVIGGCRAGMQVVWIPDPRMDVPNTLKMLPELQPTLILPSMKEFKPEDFGLPKFDE